jgi:hypothetical protein
VDKVAADYGVERDVAKEVVDFHFRFELPPTDYEYSNAAESAFPHAVVIHMHSSPRTVLGRPLLLTKKGFEDKVPQISSNGAVKSRRDWRLQVGLWGVVNRLVAAMSGRRMDPDDPAARSSAATLETATDAGKVHQMDGEHPAVKAARLHGRVSGNAGYWHHQIHEGQLAQAEPELRAAHAKEWAPKVHVLLHFVKAQLGSKV